MGFLLAVLMLNILRISSTSAGATCYFCNTLDETGTQIDPNSVCNDPFLDEEVLKLECTTNGCQKTVLSAEGVKLILRSCAPNNVTDSDLELDPCAVNEDDMLTSVNIDICRYQCVGSYCNGACSMTLSIVLVMAAIYIAFSFANC